MRRILKGPKPRTLQADIEFYCTDVLGLGLVPDIVTTREPLE